MVVVVVVVVVMVVRVVVRAAMWYVIVGHGSLDQVPVPVLMLIQGQMPAQSHPPHSLQSTAGGLAP